MASAIPISRDWIVFSKKEVTTVVLVFWQSYYIKESLSIEKKMALPLTYNFETSMIQLMKLDTTSFNEVILLLPRILEIKENIITTQSTHS